MFEPHATAASKTPPQNLPPTALPPRPSLHPHEPFATRPLTTIFLLSLTALGMFSGGIFFVCRLTDTSWAHAAYPSAGLLMLFAAASQFYLAYCEFKRFHNNRHGALCAKNLLTRFNGRVLTVVLVCGYLASLLVRPADAAAALFAVIVSLSTVTITALSARPSALTQWRKWGQTRAARRSGWIVYLCTLLLVGVELGGRMISAISEQDLATAWPQAAHDAAEPPVADQPLVLTESDVTELQLKALMASSSGSDFRVAVLGDEVVLSGSPQASFLAQLERTIPGVKIHNFGVAQAGPQQYAALVDQRLTELRPDLVLAFVSLGDDFTTEGVQPGVFEWQSLWIARRLDRCLSGDSSSVAASPTARSTPGDQQSFLQLCGPHLNVCRTPIDPAMQRRWQAGFGHLDRLIARCHDEKLHLALIAVPGEFQVNALLCEMLRRRAGYGPQDVDLQLPQRRLAAFAEQRQLPMLDLLPYLQRSARPVYERNALDWNDEGHAVAARAVSSWLQNCYGNRIAALAQLSRHD